MVTDYHLFRPSGVRIHQVLEDLPMSFVFWPFFFFFSFFELISFLISFQASNLLRYDSGTDRLALQSSHVR